MAMAFEQVRSLSSEVLICEKVLEVSRLRSVRHPSLRLNSLEAFDSIGDRQEFRTGPARSSRSNSWGLDGTVSLRGLAFKPE